MREKTAPVAFKAGPEDGLSDGEFIAYPSTFTREPDSYGDVVAKGAFTDTIAHWKSSGAVLPGLFGHRMDDPDFYVAEAIDMGEDEHGWWVKGRFDLDSPKGAQVYRLVRGKRLTQLSFAYDTLEEGMVQIGGDRTANELRKLHVHEFSFVPVGANRDTSVLAVKSAIDVLVHAGRSMSVKNEDTLREARNAIDSVLATLASDGTDQDEASSTEPAGAADDDPDGEKSSEPEPMPELSVDALLATLQAAERL